MHDLAAAHDYLQSIGLTIKTGHDQTRPAMCIINHDLEILSDVKLHKNQGPDEIVVASIVYGYDVSESLNAAWTRYYDSDSSIYDDDIETQNNLIRVFASGFLKKKFPLLSTIGLKSDHGDLHIDDRHSDVKTSRIAKMGTKESDAAAQMGAPRRTTAAQREYWAQRLVPGDVIKYDGLYYVITFKKMKYVVYVPKESYNDMLEFSKMSRSDVYMGLKRGIAEIVMKLCPNPVTIQPIRKVGDEICLITDF